LLRLSAPIPAARRGEIAIGGLGAPVEVLRDRHGIPHIYAASRGPAKLRVPEMNY
jgi:acyl-homoserine lactone acylase PvdQ